MLVITVYSLGGFALICIFSDFLRFSPFCYNASREYQLLQPVWRSDALRSAEIIGWTAVTAETVFLSKQNRNSQRFITEAAHYGTMHLHIVKRSLCLLF